MDGTIFENAFDNGNGTSIQVGREQSLPGWDEVMTYLNTGSRVTLFLPAQLAYGEVGNPPLVGPNKRSCFTWN
jgi:FKBP-type peptidyl-prolyl cis-trans isomerase